MTPDSKVFNSSATSSSNVYETPKSQNSLEKLKRTTDGFSTKKRRELLKENFAKTESVENFTGERLSRHSSEPPNMFSSRNVLESLSNKMANNLVRQSSDSLLNIFPKRPNIEVGFTPIKVTKDKGATPGIRGTSHLELNKTPNERKNETPRVVQASPVIKNKFWQVYAAHTSTPSDLLRRNLTNGDYMLTPVTNSDKSMSPITQSTTKMSKAMQVLALIILNVYTLKKLYFFTCPNNRTIEKTSDGN